MNLQWFSAFSTLTLLAGRQEWHRMHKDMYLFPNISFLFEG